MLMSSRLQNFKKGARAFMVHSPFRTLRPSFLGTSCSISELRHDDESSPMDRFRRPLRKLTHPHPSARENIVGLLSFLYFLSLRFRVHLGFFCLDLGILADVLAKVYFKFPHNPADVTGEDLKEKKFNYRTSFR